MGEAAMIVRVCIAVDDLEQTAAAMGWEIGRYCPDEFGERWDLMEAVAKQQADTEGNPPTRFVWAEIEIPPLDSPLEAKIVEIHRAKQEKENG